MFDVSLIELAVIALVALLVLGPEKLPRAAFEGRVGRASDAIVDFRDRLEEYSAR